MEDENTDYVSSKKRRSTTSDMTYGCGFTEVQSAPRKNYSTTWGPIEFDRDNHPLAIMVSMCVSEWRLFVPNWSNLF